MRIDKYPEFISYLKNMPNTEIAIHALSHCHKGLSPNYEFQDQSFEEFTG